MPVLIPFSGSVSLAKVGWKATVGLGSFAHSCVGVPCVSAFKGFFAALRKDPPYT